MANDLAGNLWYRRGVSIGDGRRTDVGDKFVAGLRHPQRYAPLVETQPPMD